MRNILRHTALDAASLKGLFLAAILAGASGAASATPSLVGSTTFGGHTYELYSNGSSGISWTDARAFAVGLGGGADLASLTSGAEISAVTGISGFNTLFNNFGLGPWVGASSPGSNQNFTWLDSSTITNGFNGFSWASGQPDWFEADGSGSTAQGVLFYPNSSSFGDYGQHCGTSPSAVNCAVDPVQAFVVERAEVPEPGSLGLAALGLAVLGYSRRRRTNPPSAS